MPRKKRSIPVNAMATEFGTGIVIEKFSMSDIEAFGEGTLDNATSVHRHDSHSFFLLKSGTVNITIDFEQYVIKPRSIIYIHPDQVHHAVASEKMVVSSWAITNENLNPEYLKLLESITPAMPLTLTAETFNMIDEAADIFIKLTGHKSDRLHHWLLKDCCNALVALVISQYLKAAKPADKLTRFDVITKSFRELLERKYTNLKRPAEYAEILNISVPYLNECVKNTTGYSVSYHIQQRVILEAKRLLYFSNSSVKEIAAALGYDDYPYFSRLFTKVTGMSALTFRNKNLG
ncbi:AraC family transcriptional regulator [Mucilaginibacter rigui]|uniref:AraC family transcriptional regulator n=2 Tax=Mucilaginibacter rigui TaxID=534635 RepID=A0ABR7X5A4_9SPHI|nr:AraC family transcriptional regulator [Mucilaginibacter rigui]